MSTTLIGSIVTPDRVVAGTLEIADGKIVRVSEGFSSNATYDFRGKYLLPGLIEVHGHLREPGLEYKEDIPHGSRAGLAGGFTTIFDMPNTRPPTTTVERVKEQIARYTGRCYSDFAINMGTSLQDIDQLREVDPALITSFKLFAAGHATTPTTIPHLRDIARVFEIAGQREIMMLVHAENQELIDYFTAHYRDMLDRHDAAAWTEARNSSVVLTSVLEMIALARQFGVKLYLLHLSTPEEFAAVAFGRSIGVDVYGETTTVHLSFNSDDYARLGNLINIAPALRSPADQQRLWQLLRAGQIDTVVTDHAPHTLEEKQKSSVWEVASGLPGFQEALPALITNWVKHFGSQTLEEGLVRIAQVTSTNLARIFGFGQKGALAVGKDADIVVVDSNKSWQVRKEDLFTKNRWSAFESMSLQGQPVATFLRGNLVYQASTIIGEARGQWLTRQ
ncbi:MAG TPA: dihydroorotase family protein [Ktedonobacteraceae bacterium]|nr:dihydroorotase family protein [Ktedonobacteraceae bacterium]